MIWFWLRTIFTYSKVDSQEYVDLTVTCGLIFTKHQHSFTVECQGCHFTEDIKVF